VSNLCRMSDAATAALLTWQLRRLRRLRTPLRLGVGDGHVFTLEDGRPLDPAYVTRPFKRFISKATCFPR
jgi:hypothetical protein